MNIRDFAIGIVATAPSPATTGLTLTLETGQGGDMPTTTPFKVVAAPPNELPTKYNSEILEVSDVTGDVLTFTRAGGETTAQDIAVGWVIVNPILANDIATKDYVDDKLAVVSNVEVSPDLVTLFASSTYSLSATVTDVEGNLITGESIAWSSSDGGVATVDSSGEITAVSPGTVFITASASGKEGNATVIVSDPDDNPFTDSEQTKLSGIETGADVTDTANVTSAGALMDSEVTNLAQVKAFDSTDYATSAQGTKADTATQPADIADFETTTELNARDTANRDRTNHTGQQGLSTISDAGTIASKNGEGFSKITVSATAPSSPASGDLWIDTS